MLCAVCGRHVSSIFAIPHLNENGDWVVIWDTGKTIGLAQEKLAVIYASKKSAPRIRDSLSVIQFDIARRAKLLFSSIISSSHFPRYVSDLRELLSRNYEYACTRLASVCHVYERQNGAFMCLRSKGSDGVAALEAIDRYGVGVIPGECLFEDGTAPVGFFRIALARDAAYFERSVDMIADALTSPLIG